MDVLDFVAFITISIAIFIIGFVVGFDYGTRKYHKYDEDELK